ncbi:MAG TPA: ABC transporter permease [bacterium]|nr:ABC transporter permease [bacterium]
MLERIHLRFIRGEIACHGKRSTLFIGGIATAVLVVITLDVLGRAFVGLATVPFRNLGADLIVQRSATRNAVPKAMGIMLPYSAETITATEYRRLASEPGVTQAAGFVLLWNFGKGRFFSISGIPLGPQAAPLGPGRVRDWLIQGSLPEPGAREVLVERHYGAFYRLKPGTTVEIGGESFTVTGVVDIQQGSQIVASNFYMDINQARTLGHLPPDLVNQVFLKLADMGQTGTVKSRIASWMPRVSVTSPGTMLALFGGVSETIGRFRSVAVAASAAAAAILGATLVYGILIERRRDLAVLRVIGWTRAQVRRQIAAEMGFQGLLGALIALGLVSLGAVLLAHVAIAVPASLPGTNPATFAAGGFQLAAASVALPISLTLWDWLAPPVAAVLVAALCGWWMSSNLQGHKLWPALKVG